jgi:hypothetical protein
MSEEIVEILKEEIFEQYKLLELVGEIEKEEKVELKPKSLSPRPASP